MNTVQLPPPFLLTLKQKVDLFYFLIMAKNICVLGAGSFGTALGCVLARNVNSVCLLTRSDDIPASIAETHRNPRYFPDFVLPDNLTSSADPEVAFKDADYILHAIPVQHSADYLRSVISYIKPTIPIVSCSKVHHTNVIYMLTRNRDYMMQHSST